MMLFRRLRRPIPLPAAAAAVTLGLFAMALQLSPAASAKGSSCANPVTKAPTGRATVSTKSTPFGTVLAVGSGAYRGCSLYLLTSDKLHALTGARFACSDNANAVNKPCDTVLWPALLTKGAPVAGKGVNPKLLRTVTRTDLPGMSSVRQVTYAGYPLYRFFQDGTPKETDGANLDDPVPSPPGIWYLVNPRGNPATGRAQVVRETAPVDGTGPDRTVLAAAMNNDFSVFPHASFPVYTLRGREGDKSTCQQLCAVYWPPVLTSGRPEAGPGVDRHALGTIERPDGTHQVTYKGRPLYLFTTDAYIKGVTGTKSINGAGLHTVWGVFNTIPRLP